MDDELQLASAWLPGRIAQSHTQVIARHLIKAVASLARSCGLVSNGAAELTTQLGETRSLNYRNQFGLVWFGLVGLVLDRAQAQTKPRWTDLH